MHLHNFLPVGAGDDEVYTDSLRLPLHHPAKIMPPSSENASPQKSSGECLIVVRVTKLLIVIRYVATRCYNFLY